MAHLPTIEAFLSNVDETRSFTGSEIETALNEDLKIQISVHEDEVDDHRNGSFSILLRTDEDLDELAKRGVLPEDIRSEYGEYADELSELIDKYCGYNPFEILMDEPSERFNEGGYDVVFHDSFVVFD